ncbi:hypothetical protein ACHAXH_008882 [Discostella pseudostelligera]
MDNIENWNAQDLRLGNLLLAVDDIVSFRKDYWTSAQARHKSMPTSQHHWMRSQMRHGSVLAVRARPIPDESFTGDDDDYTVEVFIRRKKLAAAWELMKSCDVDLWTDVCDLYALIVAVEQNPSKFEDYTQVQTEVVEAKALMHNAELLRAVETIEEYNEGEWAQEQSRACVRRGSLMVVHEHHHDVETRLEAKVRHLEHAHAWELMKSCDKDKWAAVCHYHEEQRKSEKDNLMLDSGQVSIGDATPMHDSFRQLQGEEQKIMSADLKLRPVACNVRFPAHKPPARKGSWSHAA